MPPKPIPPELLALRRQNVMALFVRWRLGEIGQGLPGEDRAFAALLGISGAQWSRVKSGTPVGSKLARQFELACEVAPDWLDQAHDEPDGTSAMPNLPDSAPASLEILASTLGLSMAELIPNEPTTVLIRADGDSMRDAAILDGNLLLVDKRLTAEHGDIVVALVDDEFIVRQLHRKSGQCKLLAAHPAYPEIVPLEGQALQIWGVVTSSIRRFR